jgi:mono/diheme cytochrome c family protein
MIRLLFFTLALIILSCGKKTPAIHETDNTAAENGKMVYTKYCLACHQVDGSGVPGMYPPLNQTDWVSGDKNRLIGIILQGMAQEIEVHGVVYKAPMPPHQYLTNEQIADVLTYIRSNFGNSASTVLPEEVAKMRNNK